MVLSRRTAWDLITRVVPGAKVKREQAKDGVDIFCASTCGGEILLRCENDWYTHNGRIQLTISDRLGAGSIVHFYDPTSLDRDYAAEEAYEESIRKERM